jgi:hypothetical protein
LTAPCLNGGVCTPAAGTPGYVCNCAPAIGFTGLTCSVSQLLIYHNFDSSR